MPCLLRSCSSEAGHGDVSTQLIQIDCLSAYHGFFIHDLSAQVMMLVYGTWTTHSHSLTPSHTLTPPLPLTLSLHSLTHTHSPTRSLSLAHSPSLTHTTLTSLTHSLTHSPVHADTYTRTNSPTITPPSLSYFLFPCCFSMLSLSLERLITYGVIRSYIFFFQDRTWRPLWQPLASQLLRQPLAEAATCQPLSSQLLQT